MQFFFFLMILLNVSSSKTASLRDWKDRPIASREWCVATPTYREHFQHTIKALQGVNKYAVDVVRLFVILTDSSEAVDFDRIAVRSSLPNYSMVDLTNLTGLPFEVLTLLVEGTEIEHSCHLGRPLSAVANKNLIDTDNYHRWRNCKTMGTSQKDAWS